MKTQVDGEPDGFVAVARTFLGEARTRLAVLGDAFRHADADAVRREAHTLKGASASLGAARLADACAHVEMAASPKAFRDPYPLTTLQAEFENLRAALDVELRD